MAANREVDVGRFVARACCVNACLPCTRHVVHEARPRLTDVGHAAAGDLKPARLLACLLAVLLSCLLSCLLAGWLV